jgi:hypothetical protein
VGESLVLSVSPEADTGVCCANAVEAAKIPTETQTAAKNATVRFIPSLPGNAVCPRVMKESVGSAFTRTPRFTGIFEGASEYRLV